MVLKAYQLAFSRFPQAGLQRSLQIWLDLGLPWETSMLLSDKTAVSLAIDLVRCQCRPSLDVPFVTCHMHAFRLIL